MLEIRGLKKHFGNNIVLDGIDLHINQGEVVSVIGPSGTGKSTLLRCVNFLENPDNGHIRIGNVCVDAKKKTHADILALRRKSAMVFQRFNLFKNQTALENVMEGLITVKGWDKAKAKTRAMERLRDVGLADKAGHYPAHLSGGQMQRVAIARSLAMEPSLLLLDEPTSSLDPELVGEVLETILKAADEGFTMLLVSHEMNFVHHVSDRVIFLDGGHILEEGTSTDIFGNPRHERVRDFINKIYRLQEPEYTI
jgi:ABC-type polar amino acid transport system ATPase subunit